MAGLLFGRDASGFNRLGLTTRFVQIVRYATLSGPGPRHIGSS